MAINLIPLAQFTLLIVFSSFLGNLLNTFINKEFFCKQDEIQGKSKVSEVIVSSIKTTLYDVPWLVMWLSLFILLPLYWHSVY
jgi:hypothetical protein